MEQADDDQENPSEEAEELLENDVNKLEIPSEITEQLEAIRKIAISPQKQLVEEVLAQNQCSSIDNRQRRKRHIEQQPGPRIEE
ncbi:unnamed protein product [Bursaphelenchus xylophilus]|uniref:(pine wood nematode) hypothetical protein n=1 Tax=Bursaphelenchus xylophilus TaxID=6326 RepID=A0A811JWN9_BURXY|nr:unnamed protein product [Bursaphelenchus xylophilus]CAG9078926.1 unnamed protein product [Bursaphelenchus xylophilus]